MKNDDSKKKSGRPPAGYVTGKQRDGQPKKTEQGLPVNLEKTINKYAKTDMSTRDSTEDLPAYKGEVYFSNPPKNNIKQSLKTKKVHRRISRKEKLSIAALISLIIAISAILSSIAISCVNDILAINRSGEIITVNIPEGADTKQIIEILDENGLIKQRIFCNIFTDLVSKLKNSKTPKYLNGVYYIKSDMGLEAMLNEFKSVQVTAKTIKLVFPEGWSIYQIIEKIDEYDVCKADYLYSALKETKFNYSFISQIKPNENRTQILEGYFFPDTYEFFMEENANSVIRRFLSNFDEKWTDVYDKRADKIGLSREEVLIIASIIQKEAANTEQMALISSVLHNRLDKPSTFPALECNSTKDYINNFVKKVIGDTEANKYLNSYNTYTTQGLPPGPICNPGLKAIEAALYPDETNYYYFQHDDSGKIYMAKTLAEQNANTMEVLRANNK